MKKYKVEITRTETFIIDVLAENEEQASDKATEKFSEVTNARIEHYYSDSDSVEEVSNIFDVTDTDDTFNP